MKRIIPLLLVLLPLWVLAQTSTSVNADCGDVYVLTAEPQTGYHFVRWSDDPGETPTIPAQREVTASENITYTALFEQDVCIVTWKYIDEFNQSHEDVEEYTYGQVINEPYDPYPHRADGFHYNFSGWLLNGEGEAVVFDDNLVADGNKVFIAAYDAVQMFLITFYDEDDATVLQEVWCDQDALPAFTNPTPAKGNRVFAGWTPQIVIATKTASYTATYAENETAGDALQGSFSVSDNKKVNFAKGNLLYNIAEDSWSLADTQYDIIGLPNINLGDPAFTGTIDMFAYSTTSTNYGVSPSNADADYTGDFRDWGQLIGDGWFTLSKDEWNYLYKRQNGNLWGGAMVADRKGIILLPDDWQLPDGLEFTPKYRVNDAEIDDFAKNKYTYDQWKRMEAAGAVFLPAAGRRTGGIGNTMNGAVEASFINPATGYYSFMDNTDIYGYYWSSTSTSEKNASYLIFNGDSYYGLPAVWSCEKRRGQSVRLVREVSADCTIETTDGATVWEDELPYTWESVTFNEAGTETLTLKATNGCDSVVTFALRVRPHNIVLQESKDAQYYDSFAEDYNGHTVTTATLNRQFASGKWTTLCLPFEVRKGMMMSLGLYGRVFEFHYADRTDASTVTIYFSVAQSIEAGKGYVVSANAKLAQKTSFIFPNVTINTDADNEDITALTGYNDASGRGGLWLVGTLRTGLLQNSVGGNTYLGLKDNKLYYPNSTMGTAIRAYRAFFRSETGGTIEDEGEDEPQAPKRVRIVAEGETVSELEVMNGSEDGIEDALPARKYLENGFLRILRNGILYDSQGRQVN